VIVDLAAERGGNCELTRPGETVVENGVAILGPLNLASEVPYHASQMYARNLAAFLRHLLKDGNLFINRMTRSPAKRWSRRAARCACACARSPRPGGKERPERSLPMRFDEATLFVFMLAAFLGFELIRRVSPLLHTPLMSLTNAISAIAVVGAVLILGPRALRRLAARWASSP